MTRPNVKLAFLFLTLENHHQGAVWETFFDAAPRHQYSIYCHPKFPPRVTQTFLLANIIPDTVDTRHADISLVRAFLLLLKHALLDADNQFFILLSEACVPLYRFEPLRNILLRQKRSWISHGFDAQDENTERWSQLSDPQFVSLEDFRKQHQWMVLTREVASMVLETDYTGVFERVYAADEHYVINVLARLQGDVDQTVRNQPSTFVNWEDFESWQESESDFIKIRPRTYRTLLVQDAWYARSQGCLFFRKVHPESDCSALTASPDWGPALLPAVSFDQIRPFWTVITPRGSNPYPGINVALTESTGEWIHILPADSMVTADFYSRMQAAVQDLPESVGLAFCRYTTVEESGGTFAPGLAGETAGVVEATWLDALWWGNPLNIPAVVVLRSVFETVGLFQDDLPYCADWEFYLRSIMRYQWWYLPETLVTYRVPPADEAVVEGASANVRSMYQRLAIAWYQQEGDRPLPLALQADSSNFMGPAVPDSRP